MIRAAAAVAALLAGAVASAGEVELRHGEDVLTGDLPRWRETSLRAEWSPRGAPGGGVSVAEIERFGHRDWALAASAHAPLGTRWDLGLEASGSATHEVVPAWSAGARAQYVPGAGFVTSGGLRWSRYDAGGLSTGTAIANVGLEYYRGLHRVAWTTYLSRVDGTSSASHALAWDVSFRARDRAGIVVSAGRELESLGGGRVLATDVLGAAFVGRTGLGAAWSLTYGIEFQRQGALYSRSGGRLGLLREL